MSVEDRLYSLRKCYEAAPQSVKTLAGKALRVMPDAWRYGPEYRRFTGEANAVENWDEVKIQAYQLRALRESLLAAGRTPWYSKRFRDCGVDPTKFESLSQLADYPLLTKEDVMASSAAMVNPEVPSSKRLYITSGGSSGTPVGFYLQKGISRPKEQAYMGAQWARRGYRLGDRVAVIRGAVTSSSAGGRIFYVDATRNWLVMSSSHLTVERVPEYLAALRQFRPQHLHIYPSAALMLVGCMEQLGKKLDFRLTSVLCGSEKLSLHFQHRIELALGAPVFHWYGHSERVVLAAQGRKSNHLYFWPTYGYVEFGDPNAEGAREVIGTSFHNMAMPLIRYRTGDLVRLAQKPDRELPGVEIEEVVGRDYEFIVGAFGRRISLTAINRHDRLFDGLLAVQFFQERAGEVELRFVAGPRWRGDCHAIKAGLTGTLGEDFALRVRQVEHLEKTSAGKHRWLVTTLDLRI